jgi:hypothetical protein
MENKQLSGCMYETLVQEGFLPETLNEGETYEGYCKTMMEDAEICMEMVKSCMMNEGSSCANEIANYISESYHNKGSMASEQPMYEDAYYAGVDPEEGGIYLEEEGEMVDEAEGINPAIHDQLEYCIKQGHTYDQAKEHVDKAVKEKSEDGKGGWDLSMEDYLEAKEKFGKDKRDGVELEEEGWMNEMDLGEGSFEVDPSYNYFAVNKATGQIFNGWEYSAETDKQSIKDYCVMDIKDNDWAPKDFNLVTASYLKKKGVDPYDSNNWAKNDGISKYMDNLHGTNFAKYGGSNPDYMSPEDRAKYEINELEEGSEDSSRYMFFSNLEQIKRQADVLMKFDHGKIEAILNSGHDWAADHMAVTKENLSHVFDFLMNEIEGEGAPEGDMTPAPMDMTPVGPMGIEGPEDKLMEYSEEDDMEDDNVSVSDQYEREMKYFTNFMNAIEKSMGTVAKALSSDKIKLEFNKYFSERASSRDANANNFIKFIQKTPEESYLEYCDRLFERGPNVNKDEVNPNYSILNLLVSPTKRGFLDKTGLMMDDNLTDALDTVADSQPIVMKKAEFIKSYTEKQDSKYKDTEDDDFSDEEPSTDALKKIEKSGLKNIEKMGNFDVDSGDDIDFLGEAELAKFVDKKGKNVDSENKKSSEKENKEAMKDAEETQETTEEKIDNLKNQKYENNSFEDEAALRQHGRNNMLDLDYTNDASEAFKNRVEKETDGLAPKDHANVDHESKGGKKLKDAVKARRPERDMDYGSKGLNIDKDFSYEKSDALKEDVVSLEIQKMMKMVSYDQNVIFEEKKAKQSNENDVFWKSVSKKKLL